MNIIEGFDILVMAVGAAALTPLADRLGRRPLTLIGLVVASAGMLLSTLASGYVQLGLCRLLTGLGVGAVIANLPVIVSEYSNRRTRGLSIAFFAVGLPLGGVVGGSTAALVTAEFGWRATFLFGGALSAVTPRTAGPRVCWSKAG